MPLSRRPRPAASGCKRTREAAEAALGAAEEADQRARPRSRRNATRRRGPGTLRDELRRRSETRRTPLAGDVDRRAEQAIAGAEKAERERDAALAHAGQAERECDLARGQARHSDAERQAAEHHAQHAHKTKPASR
jgi:hypothetical protein